MKDYRSDDVRNILAKYENDQYLSDPKYSDKYSDKYDNMNNLHDYKYGPGSMGHRRVTDGGRGQDQGLGQGVDQGLGQGQGQFSTTGVGQGLGVGLMGRKDSTSTITQLDWLLRGLPEAYDDNDTDMNGLPLDDLAIEKLINEGGKPPSQLIFPSLYKINHNIMNKLQNSKCLIITFNHLFIYSSKFGIRKNCSRLIITAPKGCNCPENEPKGIILDLPELLGRNVPTNKEEDSLKSDGYQNSSRRGSERGSFLGSARSSGKGSERGSEQGSEHVVKRRASVGVGKEAFFVGGIDLNRTVLFPLDSITDKILQSCMSGGEDGSVRVELYGHLTSPYTGISARVSTHFNFLTFLLFYFVTFLFFNCFTFLLP